MDTSDGDPDSQRRHSPSASCECSLPPSAQLASLSRSPDAPPLLPPASSSLLYTLKSTISVVPFQSGCAAASAALAPGARDSEDGSSCRFLALLALYPLVLPLFSLHPSLFADFW